MSKIDLRKWEYSPANNGYYINDGVMINFKEAERRYNSLIDYALAEMQRADEAEKPFWKPISELKPEPKRCVLIIYNDGGMSFLNSVTFPSIAITHYAEIPALPKEDK